MFLASFTECFKFWKAIRVVDWIVLFHDICLLNKITVREFSVTKRLCPISRSVEGQF